MKETTKGKRESKVLSIAEAAEVHGVTRQAIYVAIKDGKLNAQKTQGRWTIKLKDLKEYKKAKYSREKSMFRGRLLFDPKKGLYSVNQAAKILGVPVQSIYYALRSGKINARQTGPRKATWIIKKEEVARYQKENKQAKKRTKKAV